MITRRNFLLTAAVAVAGLAVDSERLLWTPETRTIILPPHNGWRSAHGLASWVDDAVYDIGGRLFQAHLNAGRETWQPTPTFLVNLKDTLEYAGTPMYLTPPGEIGILDVTDGVVWPRGRKVPRY